MSNRDVILLVLGNLLGIVGVLLGIMVGKGM